MMAQETLYFPSPRHLSQLYAGQVRNLKYAEDLLAVSLVTREEWLKIEGDAEAISRCKATFTLLDQARQQGLQVRDADFRRFVDCAAENRLDELRAVFHQPTVIATQRDSIVPKTLGQKLYVQSILDQPIVFGIGPAGTGKTYLAMAMAISALLKNEVQRIILTRPAVEAGEALGFLPGDLREKILPYLRPLYDAMNDMMHAGNVEKLAERGIIEIAPLAYMRGRTLSNAFIVLDEAQNTTPEQMMMFLTRLGDNSRMVITGDTTQVDLPRHQASGLVTIERILGTIPGIAFHHFSGSDVVRHPLVSRIIAAYEAHQARTRPTN